MTEQELKQFDDYVEGLRKIKNMYFEANVLGSDKQQSRAYTAFSLVNTLTLVSSVFLSAIAGTNIEGKDQVILALAIIIGVVTGMDRIYQTGNLYRVSSQVHNDLVRLRGEWDLNIFHARNMPNLEEAKQFAEQATRQLIGGKNKTFDLWQEHKNLITQNKASNEIARKEESSS